MFLERLDNKFRTELITDTSMLSDKQKDLILFSTNQEWGTPVFKLRHFVGDAQITAYAKMKQFIIELRNREEMVEQMEIDVAKNEALIAIEMDKMNAAQTENEKKYFQIEVDRLINDNNKFKRRLNAAYGERARILEVIQEMYDNGEAYLEDGTEIVSVFGNPDKEEELEAYYWTLRLAKQAALDILSYGHIGTGNMDAISMLSPKQQIDTLELAISYSAQVDSSLTEMSNNAIKGLAERQSNIAFNSIAKRALKSAVNEDADIVEMD